MAARIATVAAAVNSRNLKCSRSGIRTRSAISSKVLSESLRQVSQAASSARTGNERTCEHKGNDDVLRVLFFYGLELVQKLLTCV